MTFEWTKDEVDLIQFNGHYQLQSLSPCSSCRHGLLDPSAMRIAGVIGKGSFGDVYMVNFGDTKDSFALKAVEKAKMSQGEAYKKHIVNERRIMASISHPFLVEYAAHFQTKTHLYLIMEYILSLASGDI